MKYIATLVFDKDQKIYLPAMVESSRLVGFVQRGTHALFSEFYFYSQGKRKDIKIADLIEIYRNFEKQEGVLYNCFEPKLEVLRNVENAQKLIFDFENQTGIFEKA
ncbi:MAG: hypothetical protein Q4A27_01805 [bacterium]|nr:hypothetical protein [bacterium]